MDVDEVAAPGVAQKAAAPAVAQKAGDAQVLGVRPVPVVGLLYGFL